MTGPHLTAATLDALAHGTLSGPEGEAALDHAGGCLRCGGQLAQLKRQRRALTRFADGHDGDVERLWSGVAARLAQPQPLHLVTEPAARRPLLRRRTLAVAGLAALALLALVARSGPGTPDDDGDELDQLPRSSQLALEQAETDYRRAVEAVEADLPARHAAGEQAPRAALRRARQQLALAGAAAPAGRSRVRMLESYSAYLRSLRRELDEPAPDEAAEPR